MSDAGAGQPRVVAVARSATHSFSKACEPSVRLVAGLGIEGDAHQGATVKHRWLAARDPKRPNLRQVHLLHAELFDELARQGFIVRPGEMGENVTTRGLDLLGLPTGTRLRLGSEAVVELTGLRSPCRLIDRFQPGLMKAVVVPGPAGQKAGKSGVMSVVVAGGWVRPDDPIVVELPEGPHRPLAPI